MDQKNHIRFDRSNHEKRENIQKQVTEEPTDTLPKLKCTSQPAHCNLALYRLARGWSQRQRAEMIGASNQSIGRWERGEAFPQEVYLRRLCSLFDVTEEQLGLEVARLRHQFYRKAEASQASTLIDPLLPLPPHKLIGREEERMQVKQWLRASTQAPTSAVALYGLPGIGKTALALSIAYDATIQMLFPDGILWASLGPHPTPTDVLQHWAMLLGIAPSAKEDDTMLARRICAALRTRRMLLVLDDVWQLEDMTVLSLGGPNCTYLLTTRSPSIAAYLSSAQMLRVQALDERESLNLLSSLAPRLQTDECPHVSILAEMVGGHALTLTLIGHYLRIHTYSGSQRRVMDALERLLDAKVRLALQEPRLPTLATNTSDTIVSLQTVIETSTRPLQAQTRQILGALACLPSKSLRFSEQDALLATACTAADLDVLCDAGLLECLGEDEGQNQYRLHPVIADYARLHCIERNGQQIPPQC